MNHPDPPESRARAGAFPVAARCRRWAARWGAGLLGLAAAVPGAGARPKLADLLDQTAEQRRYLAEFVGSAEPVTLEGTRSGMELEIPLSPRVRVARARLELSFPHAPGMENARSRLLVSWNDKQIAVAPLGDPDREGRLSVALPPLEAGVDSHWLKVEVEQRAEREDGGDAAGPAPWTQIDVAKSWIALDCRMQALDPRLDEARDLVDEKLWEDYTLSLVTAPVYAIGESHLRWGGRVAQRAALWLGSRPLAIRHQDRLAPGGDAIAIGTRDELIGVLPQAVCDHITASFIGIYPHPEDRTRFLLVLSGTEEAGVDRAVRAFAHHWDRLPPLPRVDVTGWEMPAGEPAGVGRPEPRRAPLPDLRRWQDEAFPGATGRPGAEGFALWAVSLDRETIASAWMLAGKLAQVAGDLAAGVTVTGRRPAPGSHWLALGSRDKLPEELARMAALSRALQGEADFGRRGVVAQFESPWKRGRAGGVLTAEDRLLLRERVSELIQPRLWSSLHGDTVAWEPGGDAVSHQRLGPAFELGSPALLPQAWRFAKGLPWLSLLFGLAGVVILGWLARKPVHRGDPGGGGYPGFNGNRRASRSRRSRETARRAARLTRA